MRAFVGGFTCLSRLTSRVEKNSASGGRPAVANRYRRSEWGTALVSGDTLMSPGGPQPLIHQVGRPSFLPHKSLTFLDLWAVGIDACAVEVRRAGGRRGG